MSPTLGNIIQGYPTIGPTCIVDDSNPNVTAHGFFVVGNVSAGTYLIRVTGSPANDPLPDAVFTVIDANLDVSPGKFDLKLREGFPNFARVKLIYPSSAILTNSTGDLLFSVTLDSQSTASIQGVPLATMYNSFDLYIPPDFTGLTIQNLWTSFTNNYDSSLSLSLSKQSSSDQIGPSWWHVSVKNLIVTADFTYPNRNFDLTANRIFVANQTQYIRIFGVASPTTAGRYFFKAFANNSISIGTARFPTLVVKASIYPAYISGTLRYFGMVDPYRAGQPIHLPEGYGAQIVATGKDYLGNNVVAQAFINWAALGAYTLFGVAPGAYNITAYAAGFLPTTFPTVVNVVSAQSLADVDIYMTPSVRVAGTVLSETSDGYLVPWGASLQISIQLLNLAGSIAATTPSPYQVSLSVNPSLSQFDFSIQREVGFDGRIPQDYANYTSGLMPGDYLLRAYVATYIQLLDVYVHVVNQTLTTRSVIPLIRSGAILVTVHFMSWCSNASIRPDQSNASINGTPLAGTLTMNAYDQNGILRAQSITNVPANRTYANVTLFGFSSTNQRGIRSLFQSDYGLMPGTYHIVGTFTSSASVLGNANVGIRNLYYQLYDVQATIGLGTVLLMISFPMYKGGGIEFTLYSIDGQTPSILRPWAYPGASINIEIIDPTGVVYQANATQPTINPNLNNDTNSLTIFYSGLLTNTYTMIIQTVGYTQRQILNVHVAMCTNSDVSIWMVQDPVIDISLAFKDEGLLTTINSTQPYAQPINHLDATPIRFELFDDQGNFVAANHTYIPNGATTAEFVLSGFRRYFGDPRFVWSGFYDATDAVTQNDGGILPGTYVLRIWVDGYYQSVPIRVTLPPQTAGRKEVSIVNSVYRASRVHGLVLAPDFFDQARPLSWATVDFEQRSHTPMNLGNFTTSSLDGSFELWMPPGPYNAGVSLYGGPSHGISRPRIYQSYAAKVEVSSGADMYLYVWLDHG
ncbi:MAG TPA: carboxypeptidase-like regulatory domain-containing protein [Candidatus Bathyarchaeia archaeon]|nr:carboxypeptidase-like regulatory domain-containing protein [Candidatus Bathyarchaeia archaeon]